MVWDCFASATLCISVTFVAKWAGILSETLQDWGLPTRQYQKQTAKIILEYNEVCFHET